MISEIYFQKLPGTVEAFRKAMLTAMRDKVLMNKIVGK